MEIPVSKLEPEYQNLKAGAPGKSWADVAQHPDLAWPGCQDSKGQAITKVRRGSFSQEA